MRKWVKRFVKLQRWIYRSENRVYKQHRFTHCFPFLFIYFILSWSHRALNFCPFIFCVENFMNIDKKQNKVTVLSLFQLLNRVFNIMREKNPDMVAGEKRKFVMKPPQVVRVGTKKTSFVNFTDICKLWVLCSFLYLPTDAFQWHL